MGTSGQSVNVGNSLPDVFVPLSATGIKQAPPVHNGGALKFLYYSSVGTFIGVQISGVSNKILILL